MQYDSGKVPAFLQNDWESKAIREYFTTWRRDYNKASAHYNEDAIFSALRAGLHDFICHHAPITDRLCYTRYADDIIVSCKVIFNFHAVERLIVQLLSQMNAPFTLNETKTQFHSRAGRNWILGVMLNKDNQITVGYRKNKIFKATIDTYFRDKQKGKKWSDEDLQSFQGNITWFKDVQPDTTKYIIQKYNAKYGLDLESCIKADLAPPSVTA